MVENTPEGQYESRGTTSSFKAIPPGSEQVPAAPASPNKVNRHTVIKATTNSETGEVQITRTEPTAAKVPTGPSPTRATATNAQGQSIPLSLAGPSDLIDLPRWGNSKASVYEGMGLIRKSALGGYEVVGQEQAAPPPQPNTPAEDKPQVTETPAATAQDLTGVQPTSPATDAFQKSLESKPALFEQVITTIAKGGQPDWTELGRTHGDAREDLSERGNEWHGALTDAGAQVLRNVGISDTEAAQRWALAAHPERAADAVRALANRDVSKIAALAKEYVAERSSRLVTALEAKGVDVFTDHGSTWVSIAGLERAVPGLQIARPRGKGDFSAPSDRISLREAVRLGYITIDEG